MKDYVCRMIDERNDLSAKIDRAEKFIDDPPSGLSFLSLSLLKSQISSMKTYLSILEIRLGYEDSTLEVKKNADF